MTDLNRRRGFIISVIALGGIVLFVALFVAESGNDNKVGSADCTNQIRLSGVVYSQVGYADAANVVKVGPATKAACRDGGGAGGSVFGPGAQRVQAWGFPAVSVERAVGVRFADHRFGVYVREPMNDNEIQELIAAIEGR